MSKINKYFLPAEDVNDEKATIVELYFESEEEIEKGELIYSFETTKAVVDVEADHDGFINYYLSEGDEVTVGSLVCEVSKEKTKIANKQKTQMKKNEINIKPTKKAISLAKKHGLVIEDLGLKGIVKEKDLSPFLKGKDQTLQVDRCLILDSQKQFIKYLLEDLSFRDLASEEKIEIYIKNGHKIGDNVILAEGSVLIGNNIDIKENVKIGKGTYIESPNIQIGKNTTIGNNCEFVGSIIQIGESNKISNKVNIDISGGRFPDSNLITGRGCLIANDVYINICRQVSIGENVALSPKSMIYTHSYWQSVLDSYNVTFGPVKIDDNSWLGSMSQILPNVVVNKGSIIISNSLVTNNVKPYTMVGGVSAVIIKEGLKKDNNEIIKYKILKGLYSELGNWLYSQHCDIKKTNDNIIKIKNGEEQRSCLLLENNSANLNKDDGIDIVISLSAKDQVPKFIKTVFDIKEELVIGDLGKIELLILDFFRRKGIRFYE